MGARAAGLAAAAALLTALGMAHADGEPHPHPRIIVTVPRVHGPHDRDSIQRAARLGWGRIVRCYEDAKSAGPAPRGVLQLRLEIAGSGEVIGARRTRSTLPGGLGKCLVGAMRATAMPRSRAGSSAEITIEVAPGD